MIETTVFQPGRHNALAAIVLCGGQSTRMGQSKAWLPFGDEPMLLRVIRRLRAAACDPLVVVAAADQQLPELPADVLRACDQRPGRGPLEGLIAGLQALSELPQPPAAAYATSCDVPRLSAGVPQWLAAQLAAHQVVVPVDQQHHHPLAAVYRLSVLDALRALSDADELRPRKLFDRVPTLRVEVDRLRPLDPQLATLHNLNTPADYQAALAAEGLAPATSPQE